ncbi:MAG: metallopeptidase TldD-related protein, partial [Draconibacterium sp.]|nr:metallopeptidase TldD-related protein [Draconibacterium sp.]
MKKQVFSVIIILSFSFCNHAFSQSGAEIIKKAIKDELKRNMDSITSPSCGKPCFLSYMVREGKVMTISASFGAIVQSRILPSMSNSSRMLIGSYHLNDENFVGGQNEAFQVSQNISLPNKPDYWGIRRAIWASTERIYARACKKYQTKKLLLEENGITPDKYVLPDFSIAPVVKIQIPSKSIGLDKTFWEDVARQTSAVFNKYPEIESSRVNVMLLESTAHFMNSEGTEIENPFNMASVTIYASIRDENNNRISETIFFSGELANELPNTETLKSKANELVEILNGKKNLERLEEDYEGPVLFEGEAVSNLILNSFFSKTGLIATRESVNSNAFELKIPEKPESYMFASKLNTKVVSENISIISRSHMKQYNGKKLAGAFEVDAEGVVPPEELILIENGILRTMLNGRTPAFGVEESNGHYRLNAYRGKSIYPGVVYFQVKEGLSKSNLKEKLLEEAKEEGHDYAFIVRKQKNSNAELVYQVDLETGNEKLIKVGSTQRPVVRDFKKNPVFSDTELVANITGGSASAGMPVSIISPDAV